MTESLEIAFKMPESNTAYEVGAMVVTAIQQELSGQRRGKFYPVPGNIYYDKRTPKENRAKNYWVKFTGTNNRNDIQGSAYQASAPGEAPAVRTGRLRQSFYYRVIAADDGGYEVRIRTNVFYADDLEYGNERVAPRPFVKPATSRPAKSLTISFC
jgi:hypothetical protein